MSLLSLDGQAEESKGEGQMSDRCTCHDVLVVKNLNRWFKEKWVDVSRKDKDGKHPPCGRSKAKKGSKGYPKCRPSVKVSDKTPKTSGSMSEGEKRAATKRKRAKKQGVGGKPTIVKSVLVVKSLRQTELGEFHPDFPSSHGQVVYVHSTHADNYPSIQSAGLRARKDNVRNIIGYDGVFASTSPHVRDVYGNRTNRDDGFSRKEPVLIGIRSGAGSPLPYFGYGDGYEYEDDDGRVFPEHWRFMRDIPARFLVHMGQENAPRALPDFYDDEGNPPVFSGKTGARNFSKRDWQARYGGQVSDGPTVREANLRHIYGGQG